MYRKVRLRREQHPARDARADRRARARRRHPPRRRGAGGAAAVGHDLLVRLEGRAAPGALSLAAREEVERLERLVLDLAPRELDRARVGARGVRRAGGGPGRRPDPPRRLHRAGARGHAPPLAGRGGGPLARRAPAPGRARPARRRRTGPARRRAAAGGHDHRLHARPAGHARGRLRGAIFRPRSSGCSRSWSSRGRSRRDARLPRGGAADGPVALLVHGFPQSSYMWRDVLPALAARAGARSRPTWPASATRRSSRRAPGSARSRRSRTSAASTASSAACR